MFRLILKSTNKLGGIDMKNRKALYVLALGMSLGVGASLMAQSFLEEIKAYKKTDVMYTLNGEQIMPGEEAIIYENQIYAPIRAISEAFGYSINYDGSKVALSKLDTNSVEEVAPLENVLIKAKVVGVTSSQITVLPEGASDSYGDYLILNVAEDVVVILADGTEGKISDLKEGMTIEAEHAPFMTSSLPPQTPTYKISVVGEGEKELVRMEHATVKEILEKRIIVEKDGKLYGVNTDENTYFHHEINKRLYRLEDIEVGMDITVVHSPAMTRSIPPQVYGEEIIIHE